MQAKLFPFAGLLAAGLVCATAAVADPGFEPLAGSAYDVTADPASLERTPWLLPAGYRQSVICDEQRLDLFRHGDGAGVSDWPDMIVSNETGRDPGRYLYRSHEMRPGRVSPFPGAALSVIDRKTGEARLLAQRADWESLDGLAWTPWGSLLFAEEMLAAALADPDQPGAESGLLYELQLDPLDPGRAGQVVARPALGALAHEGIALDAAGNVYVVDEYRSGSIYKFVPAKAGDLGQGQLSALRVAGGKTGAATWVALDMDLARIDARQAARAAGAAGYCRPEDLERIGDTLYVALTCEDHANPANLDGPGAVLAVALTEPPQARWFVVPGLNAAREDRPRRQTGLFRPDNLAKDREGRLWIAEDNVPADIWLAEPDRNGDGLSDGLHLFASLRDMQAEATGIYFGRDPRTLFVNVQHSATGNDKTVLIQPQEAGNPVDFKD